MKETKERNCITGGMLKFWVPALFLCVGLILSGVFVGNGIGSISANQRVVTVRGLAEREVKANKVTWPVVSKVMGNDLASLYQQIQTINNGIVNFLKSNGIKDNEIDVNAPSVQDMQADNYGSQPVQFRYRVTTVVVVTSSDVDLVNKLISKQTDLMQQGIAIVAGDYNYQTLYEYTNLNEIKPEMIAEATKNARQAAKKFADDSKSKLGKIKTASQGQFSIDDRDQYTPYIKKVRVVSSIEYYLKD